METCNRVCTNSVQRYKPAKQISTQTLFAFAFAGILGLYWLNLYCTKQSTNQETSGELSWAPLRLRLDHALCKEHVFKGARKKTFLLTGGFEGNLKRRAYLQTKLSGNLLGHDSTKGRYSTKPGAIPDLRGGGSSQQKHFFHQYHPNRFPTPFSRILIHSSRLSMSLIVRVKLKCSRRRCQKLVRESGSARVISCRQAPSMSALLVAGHIR